MTPAARIRAAVEALDALLTAAAAGGADADVVLARFFQARRYAGAKDRRAIQDLVYTALRRLSALDRRLAEVGLAADARSRILLAQAMGAQGLDYDRCFGGPHGLPHPPASLLEALAKAAAIPDDALDLQARLAVPSWAWAGLVRRFGADALAEEAAAWDRPAPVDLRVLESRTSRPALLARLARAGIDARATPLSPLGLRMPHRLARGRLQGVLDRLAILQDEASQIAAALVDVRPGMTVVEIGAGGGGKTAALADAMRDEGRILALDIDPARLRRGAMRLKRLRFSCVQWGLVRQAPGSAEMAAPYQASRAERVVVDAPCSGSGTWRRHPGRKWRWREADIAAFQERQVRLLRQALALADTGGDAGGEARVVYITCSLLPEENEDVVAAALAAERGWEPLAYHRVLAAQGWAEPPATAALDPAFLQLTPARHGTDGLFVAVLARKH